MRLLRETGDLAAGAGRGMLAGAIGTAAMTVSSTLDAKLRGRGASSALAGAAGRSSASSRVTLGAVWGSSLVILPGLGVAPPVWRQAVTETAIDAFHHVVYAGATTLAWHALGGD